ncbi:CidA/LrgA family protein [Nocardioides sp. zg-DK7169]|uniref:CidA/LrgA family protein n=1 Tax=Nocardioides sp. zg-DK7169 TaxID=2736600 RepID=UPI0015567888|nr:CidA/LrgA family protein [Nocardioides sp. zg-DK7169]NPC98510.1 CidA/LrgA family protein [Nocardioides sp. zg-DK7169]
MVNGLMWLLGCQLVGEVVVRLTDLPVPGPVVGMAVLLVLLQVRRSGDDATVVRAADGLLRHLQLLFVPAGVGVVAYLAVIRDDLVPISVAMLGSWLAGLLVVGWSARLLTRDHGEAAAGPGEPEGAGR